MFDSKSNFIGGKLCKEFDCLVLKNKTKISRGYGLIVVDCIDFENNLCVEISHPCYCEVLNFFLISRKDGFKQFLFGINKLAQTLERNFYLKGLNPDYGTEVYRTMSLGMETDTWIGFIYTHVGLEAKNYLHEILTPEFKNIEVLVSPDFEKPVP